MIRVCKSEIRKTYKALGKSDAKKQNNFDITFLLRGEYITSREAQELRAYNRKLAR